jgi:Glycosyl hydrolases family 43
MSSVTINPGLPWLDNRGEHIQAHGGGIIEVDGTYYWFGEDRTPGNYGHDPEACPVACYASKDLIHWEFRNQVFHGRNPDMVEGLWQIERPKVFHNKKTGKFVMYMHIDGQEPDHWSRYRIARVGIAISDTVDGDYHYVRSFRPFGKESRDIGQFIDDDGQAYLIFESRPDGGFYICRLSEDYMDVGEIVSFIKAPIEGGAIVHYEGLYYCIGSYLTGWWPNPNQYCVAEKLEGPWSEFRDIAPKETLTYGSQSTYLLKICGRKKTTVLYLGDIWRPYELHDSRYLWYPLEIGGGKLELKPQAGWMPGAWSIDLATGETSFMDPA